MGDQADSITKLYEMKKKIESHDALKKLAFIEKHPEYIEEKHYQNEKQLIADIEHKRHWLRHFKEFGAHLEKFDKHAAVIQVQNERFVVAMERIASAMEKTNARP